MSNFASSTTGLQWLSSSFRLCQPLTSTAELKDWLAEAWGDVAMVNYPYPANFLEPLPEWPIRHICQHLSNDWSGEKLIFSLRDAALVYFNYTGLSRDNPYAYGHSQSTRWFIVP